MPQQRRLIVLLCVTMLANAFSIGAFPPLVPELGSVAGLSDFELGAVAGAFGLARMIADIPAGLFVARHLRAVFFLGPVVLALGVLCLGSGGPFPVLVLGRALMGVGHTLGIVGGLTAILRYRAGPTLSSSLSAYEFAAMLGMLGGVAVVGSMPGWLGWNVALLLTCTPLLIGLSAMPWVLRSLPSNDPTPEAPSIGRGAAKTGPASRSTFTPLAALAFAAGGAVAVAYSTLEQFVIPLRGSREFGLDRGGVARVLMIAQTCDLLALLPVGVLADRRRTTGVLGLILLVFGAGTALIAFGNLAFMIAGCALFGLGMAGWVLPLSVLRRETSADQVAWRTGVYRVGVDGGLFLGPFLSGILGDRWAPLLPGLAACVLVAIGVELLRSGD